MLGMHIHLQVALYSTSIVVFAIYFSYLQGLWLIKQCIRHLHSIQSTQLTTCLESISRRF